MLRVRRQITAQTRWYHQLIYSEQHDGTLQPSSCKFGPCWSAPPLTDPEAIDIGAALEKIGYDDTTAGETFELFGPTNYSMAEIATIVDREIVNRRRHINVPKRLLAPILNALNKVVWWPVGSADELETESLDQVIDKNAKTFADLGIEPAELQDLTFHYLQDYRASSYYELPPSTAREKKDEKKYLHVLDDQ